MSRSKDTGLTSVTEGTTINYGPPSTSTSDSWSWDKARSYFTGTDTPNFYRRKRAGELIPHTSFDQTDLSAVMVGEHYHSVLANTSENWYTANNREPEIHRKPFVSNGSLSSIHSYLPVADTSYAQAFVQSAAARIYSKGWDALTFAGELPSLRRMFTKTSRKMVNLARGHSSKRILELWLEGRYGWRTLAYDVRDLNDAIQNWDESRKIFTERAGTTYSSSSSIVHSKSKRNATYEYYEQFTTRVSVRGAVAGKIRPARFVVDPIKTGWELVPYSFVVDWVLSVGHALDAYRFVKAASAHTASIGTKRTLKYECSLQNAVIGPVSKSDDYEIYNRTPGKHLVELVVVSRNPTSISYKPQFTGRLLTGDLGLDLIALSRTRARL